MILTDRKLGTGGAIKKAKELIEASPDLYWFSNQFNNPDNVEAHYNGIAKEILHEVENIDYVIAGAGTSGTIVGIAKRFKQESPKTRVVGVFPPGGYQIQGIQNPKEDFIGKIYDENLLDELVQVTKDEAYAMSRNIAKEEGVFVGMSSGAALAAAVKKAESLQFGNIVVIIPDRGEKYLSTPLFA